MPLHVFSETVFKHFSVLYHRQIICKQKLLLFVAFEIVVRLHLLVCIVDNWDVKFVFLLFYYATAAVESDARLIVGIKRFELRPIQLHAD